MAVSVSLVPYQPTFSHHDVVHQAAAACLHDGLHRLHQHALHQVSNITHSCYLSSLHGSVAACTPLCLSYTLVIPSLIRNTGLWHVVVWPQELFKWEVQASTQRRIKTSATAHFQDVVNCPHCPLWRIDCSGIGTIIHPWIINSGSGYVEFLKNPDPNQFNNHYLKSYQHQFFLTMSHLPKLPSTTHATKHNIASSCCCHNCSRGSGRFRQVTVRKFN